MMLILHGENTIKSREKLVSVLEAARLAKLDITRLYAKELTVANLEEAFAATSLFGTDKVILIEELHSLPKSAKKDELIKLVSTKSAQHAQDLQGIPTLVLWEKRQLTATMLKKFSGAVTEEFKTSSLLFKWLDTFGSTKNIGTQLRDMHQIYDQDSAEFLFAMLSRQVRLLLSAKDDGQLKGAPFMVAKIKKQAQQFSLEQLQAIHTKLLEIDTAQKTSSSRMSLQQQLDLLVVTM